MQAPRSRTVLLSYPSPAPLIGALAAALLGMTLAWHIPLMLWDHLDLVPLLQMAPDTAGPSAWLDFHGGHWHAAAYVVLLATTALSDGQPWLDCVVSWALLLGFALTIDRLARRTGLGLAEHPRGWLLLLALALYPGHLPNLQWGWQVAVFICLLGTGLVVLMLSAPRLGLRHNAIAWLAAAAALLAFASALALLPVALLAILLRSELPLRHRLLHGLPWLVLGAIVAAYYLGGGMAGRGGGVEPAVAAAYLLNFVGAGVARFATDLAPWLAAVAVLAIAGPAWRARSCPRQRPWLLLMLFALLAGGFVALGRAADFGAQQAFVSRYVSFSSLFWLGWAGVLLGLPTNGDDRALRWRRLLLAVMVVFAVVNAAHLIKRAARIGAETRAIASEIRQQWPEVAPELLGSAYFDQPEIARQRLAALRQLGYSPFSGDSGTMPAAGRSH